MGGLEKAARLPSGRAGCGRGGEERLRQGRFGNIGKIPTWKIPTWRSSRHGTAARQGWNHIPERLKPFGCGSDTGVDSGIPKGFSSRNNSVIPNKFKIVHP